MLILSLCVGCDQLSKAVVDQSFSIKERRDFFGNRLILTNVKNSGAFLSLGETLSKPIKAFLLVALPTLILIAGLFYILNYSDLAKGTTLGVILLIGGGIGNVYDRFMYGSVTDFMMIDLGYFKTGIFNFADVLIMFGVGLAIISSSRRK